MAEKLCTLRKHGGSGSIGTPVAGTFTTPANSSAVTVDCTGFNFVCMSIVRTNSYSAEVFVDLTSNEVTINYNQSPTAFTISCTASNHIVSVAINGANTSRIQPYLKF